MKVLKSIIIQGKEIGIDEITKDDGSIDRLLDDIIHFKHRDYYTYTLTIADLTIKYFNTGIREFIITNKNNKKSSEIFLKDSDGEEHDIIKKFELLKVLYSKDFKKIEHFGQAYYTAIAFNEYEQIESLIAPSKYKLRLNTYAWIGLNNRE